MHLFGIILVEDHQVFSSCEFIRAVKSLKLTVMRKKGRKFLEEEKWGYYGARPPGIPVRKFLGIAEPQNSWREFPGISKILVGITGNLKQFCLFPISVAAYDETVTSLGGSIIVRL